MHAAVNTLIDTSTGRAVDLAMQTLEVTGRVYPVGAFIRVIHRFKCMGANPMEAIYVSQLPTNGTLRRFKVIGENFESDSKLEKRKKARDEYEQGVADGHLSVLAETNIDGMVHLTVGQVQPDEEISVIMDVVVGVDTKDKGFRFRFPFTLAPNYHPKAKASATEDGGTIELPSDVFGDLILPEWKNTGMGLHEVNFNLLCFGAGDLATCASPSHRIKVSPQKDGSKLISLAGMSDTPNRDLVIDVSVPDAQPLIFVDQTLIGATGTGNEPQVPQGASRWTALVPSSALPKTKQQPRKVCFVIDRSGSMTGSRNYDTNAPILGAKKALLACLSVLTADDEFGIVHFGSDAVKFHDTLGKANDANRARATKWVEGIQCNGGTEMLGAMSAATQVLGGPGGDIVLITDGQVNQTGPIVEHMGASGSRVHVLGIGTASQHRFMAQLARRTGGVVEMVSPSENVGVAGLKLFNQVKEPVLSDSVAKVNGKDIGSLGTVWDGLPLLINDPTGDGSLPGPVLVSGNGLDKHSVQNFVQVPVPDGLVALLWAGRRIEDLSSKMDMSRQGPQRDRIEQKMEDISVAYSLASRVMSLVAVVERMGDVAGVTPDQKVVAVGTPEGQNPASVFPVSQHFASILGNLAPAGGGVMRGVPISAVGGYSSPGVYGAATMNFSGDIGATRGFGATRGGGMKGGGGSSIIRRRKSVRSMDSMDLERDLGVTLNTVSSNISSSNALEDTTLDGNFFSPELSTTFLGLSDDGLEPLGAVAAAGAGGVATSIDDYDEAFKFTGNLLVDLAGLQADGGVTGNDMEQRLINTALLALIVSLAAVQTPGVYDSHIAKMADFLLANRKTATESTLLYKAWGAIKRPSTIKVPPETLQQAFVCDSTATADGWSTLQAAM